MRNLKLKQFLAFLAIGLISAFIFEEYPRILLGKVPHIFSMPGFPWFFVVYYGLALSISYLLFSNRKLIYAVLFGMAFGFTVELLLWQTMNPITFVLFLILYGSMFYLPHKFLRITYGQDTFKKREIYILVISNFAASIVLILLRLLM